MDGEIVFLMRDTIKINYDKLNTHELFLSVSINLSSYLYSILTYAIHINLAQLTLSRLAFWIMFMSNHFPAKKGDGMLSRESLKQETKVLMQEGVCFY